MWENPASCQNHKDSKMKIWLQKHAKMTFNFKENDDWTWKGREELQVGDHYTQKKMARIFMGKESLKY